MNNNDGVYYNVIKKDDKVISFPNGFPSFDRNGNYHIIHAYHPNLTSDRIMRDKINQLNTWLKNTLPRSIPNEGNDNINKASKIYNSEQKNNMMELIDWLLDPNDN